MVEDSFFRSDDFLTLDQLALQERFNFSSRFSNPPVGFFFFNQDKPHFHPQSWAICSLHVWRSSLAQLWMTAKCGLSWLGKSETSVPPLDDMRGSLRRSASCSL